MTPQEIKNGMTQGEWVETHYHHIQGTDDKGEFIADCGFATGEDENNSVASHNVVAITTAVNNTYGKGIDPEKVPDMMNALNMLRSDSQAVGDIALSQSLTDIINLAII